MADNADQGLLAYSLRPAEKNQQARRVGRFLALSAGRLERYDPSAAPNDGTSKARVLRLLHLLCLHSRYFWICPYGPVGLGCLYFVVFELKSAGMALGGVCPDTCPALRSCLEY